MQWEKKDKDLEEGRGRNRTHPILGPRSLRKEDHSVFSPGPGTFLSSCAVACGLYILK